MPTYVYQLLAIFDDPFTGCGTMERRTSTVFRTREAAEKRIEPFREKLRGVFHTRPDYPIEVEVTRLEIIED